MNPFEHILLGPWGFVFSAVWGALWGSFTNVVVVRLPAEESVVRPGSHCRKCHIPVRWYDNIPMISYLILRGKCRCCGAAIAIRYFLVEFLVCALSVGVFWKFVVGGTGEFSIRLCQFVVMCFFCVFLTVVAFIDLDTKRIPNALTYPGIPIAIIVSVLMPLFGPYDGLIGGAAGYLGIRIIADLYKLITGRLGMGYGDAKLLSVVGGLLGWQALFPTLLLGSLQGCMLGIPLLILNRRRNKKQSGDDEDLRVASLPFGPFLSLGAIEFLFFNDFMRQFFPFLQ